MTHYLMINIIYKQDEISALQSALMTRELRPIVICSISFHTWAKIMIQEHTIFGTSVGQRHHENNSVRLHNRRAKNNQSQPVSIRWQSVNTYVYMLHSVHVQA